MGPAGLYFLYPRCVRDSSENTGAVGACAFLLDFLEDFHFRKGFEEEAEGGLSSLPPAPPS